MKTRHLTRYELLLRKSDISKIGKAGVRIAADGFHLDSLAPPAEKEKTAGDTVDDNVKRVARVDVADEAVGTDATGERQPGIVIGETGEGVGTPGQADDAIANDGANGGVCGTNRLRQRHETTGFDFQGLRDLQQ